MKGKIKLLLMTFIAVMLCAVGVNAESWFLDVNITDSYGKIKDYYYIGESFSITADFYSENTEDYSADIMIALYDVNGVLQQVKMAQKTQKYDYLEATADFSASDAEEMYVKCYIWKDSTMYPLSSMSGYYINGKIKSEDVSIYYADVADITASEISAYTNTNTTETIIYSLASPCNVVINGQSNANGIDILTSYYGYLQGNPVLGDIVLKDDNTDGLYESIEAKIGFTAIADSVVGNTVYFSNAYSYELGALMRVNDGVECTVILDGEEIGLADINEGDLLTIYYDMNEDFRSSSFYEIHVSRKKVSGQVTGIMGDESIYIDNIKYLISPVAGGYDFDPLVGYGYDVFFDADNKAVYCSRNEPMRMAIIESVYVANGDQYYARIIKTNGEEETYLIRNHETYEEYCNYVYYDSDTYEKRPIWDRVWTYNLSESTGNITLEDRIYPDSWEDVKYREEAGKFGLIKISKENTDILDCTMYESENEVYPMQIESLIDGALYTVHAFDELDDGTYSFVVITAASEGTTTDPTAPTATTEFVVYSKSYITEVDGEDKTAWLVYRNNGIEAVEVILDDGFDYDEFYDIVEGTPVILDINSAGYVEDAAALFDIDILTSYSEFSAAVRAGMKADDMSAVLNETNLNMIKETDGKGQHDWVFGVVMDKSAGTITLATASDVDASGYVNIDYLDEYNIDTECGVMTYSYGLKNGLRVANTILSEVPTLATPSIVFDNDSNDCLLNLGHQIYINETATYGNTTYALAKTVDGDIVELYAIIPSATK